jgi:dTDP-4-dehydrorhamnose reductase
MKLLIIGGNGMAGHMLVRYFVQHSSYSVYYTSRNRRDTNSIYLDVRNRIQLEKVIYDTAPDIVINGVGILNESANKNEADAYRTNGYFPHELRSIMDKTGGKLIHISTDCVFQGDRGDYTEDDIPDGSSTYAKSKALGEVRSDKHLTIRTSLIGPEIREQGIGLWKWFMQQSERVEGYTNVMWNGITTLEFAKAVHYIIEYPITGLIHLRAPEKISKYKLLNLFQEVFNKCVQIIPDDKKVLNRTLQNTRTDLKYLVPNYKKMLIEMHEWLRSE